MNKDIFTRDEFIVKFKLQDASLREWERAKLLKPAGFTDEKIALYSEEMSERAAAIQKLTELGYETPEIQKILKKIGLPGASEKKRKLKDPDRYLTVGDLAERVGPSPRTIKHWEDKGIIEPDMRSEGGFRLYSEVYVASASLSGIFSFSATHLKRSRTFSDSFREFPGHPRKPGGFPAEGGVPASSRPCSRRSMSSSIRCDFSEGHRALGGPVQKKKKDIS